MSLLTIIAGVVLGGLVTTIVGVIIDSTHVSGTLKIDVSDPEKDKYLLEITRDLSKLPKMKKVTLLVKTVKMEGEYYEK